MCCGILIPVNIVFNLKNVPSKARDQLSMMTIANVSGNILFVHVAASYIICEWLLLLRMLNAGVDWLG